VNLQAITRAAREALEPELGHRVAQHVAGNGLVPFALDPTSTDIRSSIADVLRQLPGSGIPDAPTLSEEHIARLATLVAVAVERASLPVRELEPACESTSPVGQ
jgi:hypothetical protein